MHRSRLDSLAVVLTLLAGCRSAPPPARGPLFGGDPQALETLARARADARQGRIDAALRDLRALRARLPGEFEVRRALQDVLVEAGRLAEARGEAEADLAREETPLTLTLVARLAPTPEDSRARLARALAIDPGFAPARHGEAMLLLAQGRRRRAEEALLEIVRDDPDALAARIDLARLLYDRGDLREARVHEEAVLRLDPGDLEARHNLAVTLFHLGDPKGADREFRRVLAVAPDDLEALFGLAAALLARGHGTRAAQVYERIAVLTPRDPRLSFSRGVLFQDYLDDPKRALEAYREYLSAPAAGGPWEWGLRLRVRLWTEDLERESGASG